MALFSKDKKKSERERILGQEIKDVRYETLSDALKGELSIGSQDSKITKFQFPAGREFVIVSAFGKLLAARDSAKPVNLEGFLYWTDLSSKTRQLVSGLQEEGILTESVISLASVQAPEALTVLQEALYDSTLEALAELYRSFSSYSSVDTELFRNHELVDKLLPQGIELHELEELITSAAGREEELLRIMGIHGASPSEVRLITVEKSSEEVYVPEKRFVAGAADANATLEETRNISSGFRWVSVLQRLYELLEKELVSLQLETVVESLPDDFSITRPYERIFKLTLDIDLDISILVDKVFEFSSELELAQLLVRDNGLLEARISEIEDWLIRELASEDYEEFDDLPGDLQASARGLLLERSEANSKRERILKKLSSMIIDDSHTTEDDRLRESIQLKLDGIERSVHSIPALAEEPFESGFHLSEEEPEFNFNDGRLIRDAGGALVVEHLSLEDSETVEEPEEQLSIDEMLKLAEEEVKPELPPVNVELLDAHLERLKSRRRRRS